MNRIIPGISTQTDFTKLVEELKNATLTRDYISLEKSLNPYFDKDLGLFPSEQQAYLSYFLGYFFVHFGKTKNIPNFQEVGRDYLTIAKDIFSNLGWTEQSLESQITLGWSYYQTGQAENYEVWLLDALSQCNDPVSDFYQSVQVSLLICHFNNFNIEAAIQIIKEIEIVGLCNNLRVQWQFFQNSGRVYRLAKNFPKSFYSFQKAIEIAKRIKNLQFEALSFNSLAYLYLDDQNFDLALEVSDISLKIFKSLKQQGFIATVLDTKATIYLAMRDFEEAHKLINSSIFYFRHSECFAEFAESLWNKIQICIKLKRKIEIIETYSELVTLFKYLDLNKQQFYKQKFKDICVFPSGDTYEEQLSSFQIEIVKSALESSKNKTDAARKLGYETHHNLSNLIKRLDLDKTNRKPRSDKDPIKPISYKGEIVLPNTSFQIDPKLVGFYKTKSGTISISEDVLLVYHTKHINDGDLVIMNDQIFLIAEVVVEADQFYLVDKLGFGVHKEALYHGKILGFASAAKLNNKRIVFRNIEKKMFGFGEIPRGN